MRTNLDWSGSGLSCKIRRSPTAKLPRARDVDCWALKDCVTRRFFVFIDVSSTQVSARIGARLSTPGRARRIDGRTPRALAAVVRGRRIDGRTPRGFGCFGAVDGPARQVVPHVLLGERAAGQVLPFTACLQFGGDDAHAQGGPLLDGNPQGVE